MDNPHEWPDLPGETGVVNRKYYYGMTDRYGAPHVGDATVEIQNTIDSALALDVLAYGCGNFTISAKVVFKGHADFSGATFHAPGTLPIAVEASTGGVADTDNGYLANKNIKFPAVLNTTKPALGWVEQGIGVRVVNAYSCNLQFANVRNYGIGAQFAAFGLPGPNKGKGAVYNTVTLGHAENNKINIDFSCNDQGWTNEILLIGGRLSHYSDEGINVPGTRHIRLNGGGSTVNNVVFIKPSIEGDVAEYHVENAGSFNEIYNARWEAATPKVLYTGSSINQGAKNRIIGGYGVDDIKFTYTGITGGYNSRIGYNVEDRSVSYGLRFQNGSSSTLPIFTFFNAGTAPETAPPASWMAHLGALYYKGKTPADTYERIRIENATGGVFFGDGTSAPTKRIGPVAGGLQIANASLYPTPDNASTLGKADQRWAGAHFGTAPVVTSDRRAKVEIAPIDAAVLRAWARVNYQQFRLKDSVEQKGEGARLHVGVIAQDVEAAFKAEGLNPFAYGVLCYDEWESRAEQRDAEGNVIQEARAAGNRYGVRYDQALVLEAALMRHRMDNLEADLPARP